MRLKLAGIMVIATALSGLTVTIAAIGSGGEGPGSGYVRVEMEGQLRAYRMILFGQTAAAVRVDDTEIWLDYSNNEEVKKKGIVSFDGKAVIVKGRLEFRELSSRSEADGDNADRQRQFRLHGQPVVVVESLKEADEDLHTIPASAKSILEHADSFELLSINPVHPSEKPAADFHGWEVLGKKSIARADRKELVDAFEQAVADKSVRPAHCFNPRHGIRVTRGSKSADFVICFECHQVRVYVDGEKEKLILVSASPQDLFNKVLSGGGVKLPED